MHEKAKFHNSLTARLTLVTAAFLLMFLSSCMIMYTTLNDKLLVNAEATMDDTQALFSRIISEPGAVINLIANNIEGMYNRGAGTEAINNYIIEVSTEEFKKDLNILSYYGAYIYFEETGELYEGFGWTPGEDYVPKSRPWYIAAELADGKSTMTPAYIDANTGQHIVSYARRVYDTNGTFFATVVIDVFVDYLKELVVNKHITPNSYGFMIDESSIVIMHPIKEVEGELFSVSNPAMAQFKEDISLGRDISFQRTVNMEGKQSIIFGRMLNNGWYFVIQIPVDEYYAELYQMIVISGIISILFAGALIITFVGIEQNRRVADEEHHKNLLQLAEAEGATRAKSTFLAKMSHEIRTPMNAILGITEIVLQKDSIDDDTREALNKIYTSGDLLLGIINDILDLSKIEAGKLEINNTDYEMASLISDTVQINISRIGSKPIEFKLEVDENIPVCVNGDELRVKQILSNILSNAFKYTDKGTVTLSVSAQKIEENQANSKGKIFLIFRVSDTGQGMTKEQIADIFSEYTRFNLEANRTTEGTGLGMNITQNLIEQMGGTITVESEPGYGSVFTVRIQQGIAGNETLSREMIENLRRFRGAGSRAQLRRVSIMREPMPYGKVLVVDDVETNIYVVGGLLAPYSLKVESADSGYAALSIIENGKEYDIIFMDHMMPDMDGVETTRKIREKGYKLPIIALTANAVAGQADMFLENGFDDYISKPIDVRQLNNALNKWIRDKQPPEVIEAAHAAAREKESRKQQSGGNEIYEVFVRDASKSVPVIEEIIGKQKDISEEDMRKYVVRVHGLKSALANVGQSELSAAALRLEMAGRDGDVDTVAEMTPDFLHNLKALLKDLTPKETDSASGDAEKDKCLTEDTGYLRKKLDEIKAACDNFDEMTASTVIAGLRKKTLTKDAQELLSAIAEQILHSDFEEAGEAVTAYAASLPAEKPQKSKPDNETVGKLIEACKNNDATAVNALMNELDSYTYEDGNDLISWLRQTVAASEYTKIVETLT